MTYTQKIVFFITSNGLEERVMNTPKLERKMDNKEIEDLYLSRIGCAVHILSSSSSLFYTLKNVKVKTERALKCTEVNKKLTKKSMDLFKSIVNYRKAWRFH